MSRLVSVVTVFHNRAAHIASSVGSLLNQTYRELEIIVIDDGSTDDTANELAKLSDSRLDIRIQANTGFTPAIESAVRSAKGEIVAIHGSGDISAPTRIERQLAALDAHPEVVVTGCLVTNQADEMRTPTGSIPVGVPMTFAELADVYPMTHGEAMFRKSVFEQVGGYRPFFQLAQDYDLWLRMNEYGNFFTVPEPLYQRRQFDNSINTNIVKLLQQQHYASFAHFCGRTRLEQGYDPLDRFGNAGALMLPASKPLAKRLTAMGLKALANGDQNGRLLIGAALAKHRSPRTLTASGIARAQKRWPKTVPRILQALFKVNR